MNRIDEEQTYDDIKNLTITDDTTTFTLADQYSSGQLPTDNIYSSKYCNNTDDRSKYQTGIRQTSLPPSRQYSSLNENCDDNIKQRRRYSSESTTSHNNNNNNNDLTFLVTSFLQHLRNELKLSTNGETNIYYQYRQQKSSKATTLSSLKAAQQIIMNPQSENNKKIDTNDHTEIVTLINLLILRVECLSKEKKPKKRKKRKDNHPTVAEVDQSLIEYLYYLFKKFINEETNSSKTIDKNNFVDVCQNLVRNGCFDISSSSDVSPSLTQSYSESISISDQTTLTSQTSLNEYHHDTTEITDELSLTDDPISTITLTEKENFLQSDEIIETPEAMNPLPILLTDEPLLITNDIYKSCESGSTQSIYLSPNSSSFDLQNMVQEFDDTNPHGHISFNEDGSSSNVTSESKTIITNDDIQSLSHATDIIYTRLTNDSSLIENTEQMTTNTLDKMSRREKKMQERWSISTKTDNNNEPSSQKPLLDVHFPPIAVLRKKFSPSKTTNNTQTTTKEINTSPMTTTTEQTKPDQIVASTLKDLSSLIHANADKNNDDGQFPVNASELVCLSEEETMMRKKESPSLSYTDCQTEVITNIHNDSIVDDQQTSNQHDSVIITNPVESNLLSSIDSSSLTLTTNENKTNEYLLKEKEEEKKEEQQHCSDDYNVEEEKKNNSSFVHDYHAPGIILRNDELRQTVLLEQEKKEKEEREERERPSSPLPTLEQFNKQRIEDESPIQSLSNNLNKMATANTDYDDERYKKIEIEEIPDEDDLLQQQNIVSIEPTDCILTDDEPKQPQRQSSSPLTKPILSDEPIPFENVFQFYETAMSKIVDLQDDPSNIVNTTLSSTTSQLSADDPIALRAIKRFEERMNAAAPKTFKDDMNTKSPKPKPKSSWSGSLSSSRKSLENLFKNIEQQISPNPIQVDGSNNNDGSTDTYIRPRKTFDDKNFNYGTTLDSVTQESSSIVDKTIDDDNANDDGQKVKEVEEEKELPSNIVENDDKRVLDNETTNVVDSKNQSEAEQQTETTNNTTIITSESDLVQENDSSIVPPPASTDDSILMPSLSDAVVAPSLPTEEIELKPYGFQLEGRRRLNTIERMRERRRSREYLDKIDQEQQQQQQQQQPQQQPQQNLQSEYTTKPDEDLDPIVRRALERFDERNRKLTQTKSMNYDDIQDPITRRALMRLESNLKRTIPSAANDSNENWYTESYTLGTLQPANDRLSRYDSTTQPAATNNRTKYNSVHQRYCAPSSNDMSDFSVMNENDIPTMRVPTQPVYVTSNNQQQQTVGTRQRSRSEDMLSSRDLQLGQTTNLDDVDTSSAAAQLQRNRSSNEIPLNEAEFRLPNTLIKTIEPNFVRTTEASVSYVTPTQTYSAYSCEYTRPRRNPLVTTTASTSDSPRSYQDNESNQISSPTYLQQEHNEIQRPIPYRPSIDNQYEIQSSSAFAPVRSSIPPPPPPPSATTTTTTNYYSQQPLPTSSLSSTYASNNLNQTPYSDDPIVRRALERFNSQLQNSLLTSSQYQPSYLTRSGTFNDNYFNSTRPSLMTTSTISNGSTGSAELGGGYRSIIGRRRFIRYDDPNSYFEAPIVGEAYSSSIFSKLENPPASTNNYVNLSDQPPAIPPRMRRSNYQNEDMNDHYRRHSTDDYLSENINNNNNSQTIYRDPFIHHAYPATITNIPSFRPINTDYVQQYDPSNQISQEQEDLRHRTQSTSSTNSSESIKQQQRLARPNSIRTQQARLPPRANIQQLERKISDKQQTNKFSPVLPQSPSGQTSSNNGTIPSDSVFHRLAYTGTKASLSKSSSNSCSNLLNKNASQVPTNQLKTCEIDFDDALNSSQLIDNINNENHHDQSPIIENKYPRSKSVDGRARLKILQARANQNHHASMEHDENNGLSHDEHEKPVPSSRFTSLNNNNHRRDLPQTRVPITPPTIHRTSSGKRLASRGNLPFQKNGFRTPSSNGNLIDEYNQQADIENHDNITYIDNRPRTSIPVQHYPANNIQTSSSASSVNSTTSRTKPPVSIPISFDRRDSNSSNTDLNRTSRRLDDNRFVSPSGQRRNIPVSVFAPAKLDNKRPAPAPPTTTTLNSESQNQTSFLTRSSTSDNNSSIKSNECKKSSSSDLGVRNSNNMVVNEFTIPADKQDTNKKMNVFERLFRGNKKKN